MWHHLLAGIVRTVPTRLLCEMEYRLSLWFQLYYQQDTCSTVKGTVNLVGALYYTHRNWQSHWKSNIYTGWFIAVIGSFGSHTRAHTVCTNPTNPVEQSVCGFELVLAYFDTCKSGALDLKPHHSISWLPYNIMRVAMAPYKWTLGIAL
jgi:hypothetical protein